MCLVADDNFDHLVKVASAGFLHCTVNMFPFAIISIWGGDTLKLCSLNLQPLTLAFISGSSLQRLLLWFSNGDFSIFFIHTTTISWNQSIRKSCFFSSFYFILFFIYFQEYGLMGIYWIPCVIIQHYLHFIFLFILFSLGHQELFQAGSCVLSIAPCPLLKRFLTFWPQKDAPD